MDRKIPRLNVSNLLPSALPTGLSEGADGARYQIGFNPDGTGLSFAFQKLTEGSTYQDTSIEELWLGVQKLQVRGGYHYQRSGVSWSAQLSNYLNTASRHDYNIHAVDMEGYGNTYSSSFFADARRIIDGIRDARNQKVLLYTNIYTYNSFEASIKAQYSDAQKWLNELDLWIAYPSLTLAQPPLPAGRSAAVRPWTMWQNDWSCSCGFTNVGDHDFFNGDVNALLAWAGVSAPPPPPPSGVDLSNLNIHFSTPITLNIDGYIYSGNVDNLELTYTGKE